MLGELYEKILGLTTVLNSNIRDASTEAILGIAEGLLPNCSILKEAKTVASRQLASEDDSGGKRDKSSNPKVKAFAAQLDEYSKVTSYLKRLSITFSQCFDRIWRCGTA